MKLPLERKLWILRKYVYGGIPPTDPRILNMTEEQIELEYAHLELDRKLRNGSTEFYEDKSFEEYDKETEEMDAILSDPISEASSEDEWAAVDDPDEWEDVEIDDFDDHASA